MCITADTFSQSKRTFRALVELNGKHGCIDEQGREAVPLVWDDMGFYGSNLIPVNKGAKGDEYEKKGGKWGYCDTAGNLKIALQYDAAWVFTEGLAAVRIKNKWGFIDTTGKLVIQPQYDKARLFHNGLCAVAKGKKWGFVDAAGKEVIKLEYGEVNEFDNGLAVVFVGERADDGFGQLTGSGYCVINKKGERLFEPKYQSIGAFRDGLAPVKVVAGEQKTDTKEGYINEKGELVIPAEYDDAQEFTEGMAIVAYRDKSKDDGYAYGVINTKGEVIVKPQYDRITRFENGTAIVQKGRLGSGFYVEIDTRNNSIVNHESHPKCALINTQGDFILNFDWQQLYRLDDDLFIARRAKFEGTGVINSKGETLLPFDYVNLTGAGNNLLISMTNVSTRRECKVVDRNNKVLFSSTTHYVQRFTHDVGVLHLRAGRGDKNGLLTINGEILIKDKYDSISDFYLTE